MIWYTYIMIWYSYIMIWYTYIMIWYTYIMIWYTYIMIWYTYIMIWFPHLIYIWCKRLLVAKFPRIFYQQHCAISSFFCVFQPIIFGCELHVLTEFPCTQLVRSDADASAERYAWLLAVGYRAELPGHSNAQRHPRQGPGTAYIQFVYIYNEGVYEWIHVISY